MLDAAIVGVLLLLFLPVLAVIALFIYDFLPSVRKTRQEAQERAERMLRSVLSVDEYLQIRTQGYLEVASPSNPNRVYRIPAGQGTVAVLENGRCIDRLCAQPTESVPDREMVVIHKLMIEGNEQEYLNTANHFPCLG